MKKIRGLILGIFLCILLANFASASLCEITTSCDNSIIMKLSSPTNAHGEVWDGPNYNYYLCCDIEGNHECNEITNKVVGLSATTNAHAQIPSLGSYPTNVCFGNLTCTSREGTCNPDELTLMSLSGQTNAHIGEADDYDTKICCKGMCSDGLIYHNGECVKEEVAYWADGEGNFLTKGEIILGVTELKLILENSLSENGSEATFDIYEKDFFGKDYIKSIEGTVAGKYSEVLWKVTGEDLEPTHGDYDDFYFEVENTDSSGLGISVVSKESYCESFAYCRDYKTENSCEMDVCGLAGASVEKDNSNVVCGEVVVDGNYTVWYNCTCKWSDGVCGPGHRDYVDAGEELPKITGACIYHEDSTDDCEDGFLDYSWLGEYIWDINNTFGSAGGEEGWVEEPSESGSWHYDPLGRFTSCEQLGTNRVQCPIAALLPFFTIINITIVVIVIIIAYYLLSRKNTAKKTVKKKKKTKKNK